MIWNILLTLLVFVVIIVIHEAGHFTAAKLSGVRVNEFALGMGPALVKKKWGETTYSIRAFPVGGFCSMEGEDASSEDPRAFCNIKVWKRIIVVLAGAIMNLFLGYLILVGVTCSMSVLTTNTVAKFADNASTEASGLQVGDVIKKVNGRSVWVESDISYELIRDEDGVVEMEVLRDGERVTLPEVTFAFEGFQGGRSEKNGGKRSFLFLSEGGFGGTVGLDLAFGSCHRTRIVERSFRPHWYDQGGRGSGQGGSRQLFPAGGVYHYQCRHFQPAALAGIGRRAVDLPAAGGSPWEAGEVGARRACPCYRVCTADPFDGGRSSQRYF